MEVIKICIVLCLMNIGLIHINDKVKSKKALMYRLLRRGFIFVCYSIMFILGLYNHITWQTILIEAIFLIADVLVEYKEEITIKMLVEIDLIACFGVAIVNINFKNIIALIIIFLVVLLYMMIESLIIQLLYYKEIADSEIKVIMTCCSVIAGIMIGNCLFKSYEIDNVIVGVLIFIGILLEMIGYWMHNYLIDVDNRYKTIKYINEKYEVERVSQMYTEGRKLRHDLKQCLSLALVYIVDGKYEDAKEFIEKIIHDKINSSFYKVYCDNRVLNYILNDKNEKCIKENITFSCMVLGTIGIMDDVDLCILVGNVIDNAIEAAIKTDNPYVNIEISSRGGLFIDVDNPICETFLGKDRPFVTTKKNRKNHGIGIKSITDIVSKYNGEINYEEKKGTVTCHIYLSKK